MRRARQFTCPTVHMKSNYITATSHLIKRQKKKNKNIKYKIVNKKTKDAVSQNQNCKSQHPQFHIELAAFQAMLNTLCQGLLPGIFSDP